MQWTLLLLLVSGCLQAAGPVRLRLDLAQTSVPVNREFTVGVDLLDEHDRSANAARECEVSVEILKNGQRIQPALAARIPASSHNTSVHLRIAQTGIFRIRATSACVPGLQAGQIYVNVRAGSGSLARPPFLLLVSTAGPEPEPEGPTIHILYPDSGVNLKADGNTKARIQVFVDSPSAATVRIYFAPTGGRIDPNPLDIHGDSAIAYLTSFTPGFFTVSAGQALPQGIAVIYDPTPAPPHHFKPDIQNIGITPTAQQSIPAGKPIDLTVTLWDGVGNLVAAEDPVSVSLEVNPGNADFGADPLVIPPGQSQNHTSFTAHTSGHYQIQAAGLGVKSTPALEIDISALSAGYLPAMLGGLAGACVACFLRRKFDWRQLPGGALAAGGVFWAARFGFLHGIGASMIPDSYSAAIVGAIAGFGGAKVLSYLLKLMFPGMGSDTPSPKAQAAGGGE